MEIKTKLFTSRLSTQSKTEGSTGLNWMKKYTKVHARVHVHAHANGHRSWIGTCTCTCMYGAG